MLINLIFLISLNSFSQTSGCIFLEGIELPCFGGGVACGSCPDQYSAEEMANACRGTLPLNNPSGCGPQQYCGTKCCQTCDQFNPEDYYTCQNLPSACDADGNTVSCGVGTKEPTCESCASTIPNRCGTFKCGPCQIDCQGELEKMTCYTWSTESVPSGTCSCPNIGATPGTCNGGPTGVSECGGSPNPCGGGTSNSCEGRSNTCWTCTWQPGNPGVVTPTCNTGTSTCYKDPLPYETCGIFNPHIGIRSCPSGSTSQPTRPNMCEGGGSSPQCSSNSDCSCP